MPETLFQRRKRLTFRAWHRGTREMDLVLGPFADAHFGSWSGAQLDRIETLMDHEDTDLLAWLIGQKEPMAGVDTELLNELRAFRERQSQAR